MQSHQQILSVAIYKGTIVAICDDGSIWQWLRVSGEWSWIKLFNRVEEPG